jgi:hypothetical protein
VVKCAGNAGFSDIYWPVLEAPHPRKQPKQAVVK